MHPERKLKQHVGPCRSPLAFPIDNRDKTSSARSRINSVLRISPRSAKNSRASSFSITEGLEWQVLRFQLRHPVLYFLQIFICETVRSLKIIIEALTGRWPNTEPDLGIETPSRHVPSNERSNASESRAPIQDHSPWKGNRLLLLLPDLDLLSYLPAVMIQAKKMVGASGFEPLTSSVSRKRSPPELRTYSCR